MIRPLSGLVALLAIAAAGGRPFERNQGQPFDFAQGQPTFRSGVDLVQVDLVVVDKDGNPVRGLKPSDFTVRDRGKLQTIATFQEITHDHATDASMPVLPTTGTRDVASNQSAQADRLVVMVVDDLHIWKGRTDKAKDIAHAVLNELGAEASMAVLFTSGEHSTQVTQDPSTLTAAVDTLKGRQSWRRPHAAIDDQKASGIDPEAPLEVTLRQIGRAQSASLQDFFDNMTFYKTLQDAGRLLGGGDARRKAFVVVSEGIGKDLAGVFDAEVTPCEAQSPMAPCFHDIALHTMMESLRRSNVAAYAVDPRGHVSAGQLAVEAFPSPPVLPAGSGSQRPEDAMGDDPASGGFRWNNPIRQAQDGLKILSEASGGFAVVDTDDFTTGVGKIVADLDHYYLIGFYPSDTKGKGYRPIDVRVAGHPDWTLRFRRGYMPGPPPPPPKNSDPLVALSAGILPRNDLALRLSAIPMPMPGDSGLARVVLALEVSTPRAPIQERDGKLRDTLKYEVLVVDEKKAKVRSVGGLEGRLTLSPTASKEAPPETVVYQVTQAIDAPPGRFEFRVSAMSSKFGKGGSVYLDLEVPNFHAAPVVLGGLVVGYADGARVPVAPTAIPTFGRSARPAPAPVPSLPFAPTLDRVFTASDTLRVYLEAAARSGSPLIAAIDVLDARGKIVSSQSPSFTSGDPVRLSASVPLAGLSPGAYALRASLTASGRTVSRETPFAVR
jgi:VWFA-related protein